MKKHLPWPGKKDPIIGIEFELMIGFDEEGQPVYKHGRVRSDKELDAVQVMLEPLQHSPSSITSVTMGKVYLKLYSGTVLTIRPVFHPSLDVYRDIFKVGDLQYHMPASFANMLELWRGRLLDER